MDVCCVCLYTILIHPDNPYLSSLPPDAADRATRAKCPKCRAHITSTIPNKMLDAGIEDCLKSIRAAAVTVAQTTISNGGSHRTGSHVDIQSGGDDSCVDLHAPVGSMGTSSTTTSAVHRPDTTGLVSESQDLFFWTERYEANEVQTKAQEAAPATTPTFRSTAREVPGGEGRRASRVTITTPLPFPRFESPHAAIGYHCEDVWVEYARSGRASCLLCHEPIPFATIRFGVTRISSGFAHGTSYLHANCAIPFNAARLSARETLNQRNGDHQDSGALIELNHVRGLTALSRADQNVVLDLLRYA